MSNENIKIKIFKGKVKSIDEKNFTVDAVISDQTIDRYNEIILASAWKKRLGTYKKHPVLLTSHNYGRLQSQIGELKSIKVNEEDKTLEAKIKYYVNEGNIEADWGFKLAQKGIAAFSVGFISHSSISKWDEKTTEEGKTPLEEILAENSIKVKKGEKVDMVFTEVELLENSQVVVPANPAALQKGMESEKDPVIKEIGEELLKTFSKEDIDDLKINDVTPEDTVESKEEEIDCEFCEDKLFSIDTIEDIVKMVSVKSEGGCTCEDVVKTASVLIEEITTKRQAELFSALLKDNSTVKALTDQLTDMVKLLKEEVIDLINAELDVIKSSIKITTISSDDLDTKGLTAELSKVDEATEKEEEDDGSSTYLAKILEITNSLKK